MSDALSDHAWTCLGIVYHSSCPDYRQWGHRSSYFTQSFHINGVSSTCPASPLVGDFPLLIWYIRHEIFILWCHFLQCPLEIGCASAERVEQGKWVRVSRRVQKAWPFLGSILETPWLAPGRPFLSYYACPERVGLAKWAASMSAQVPHNNINCYLCMLLPKSSSLRPTKLRIRRYNLLVNHKMPLVFQPGIQALQQPHNLSYLGINIHVCSNYP